MAEYIIQEETLINIADAIREKEGGSEVGPVALTWDGDTTGKLCFLMGGAYEYYKISDFVFSNEELKAGTATYVEETGTVRTVPFADVWHIFQEAEAIGDELTYLGEVLVLRDVSQSEFGEMFTNGEPETGTFFPKLNAEHTTSFTTTATIGGGLIPVPDFAPRILALSGGEQATPEISVDESGLITATAGDKSATKQLSTQSGKTITPGATEQIAVAAGKYVTGDVKVAAVESTGGGSMFATYASGNIPVYETGRATSVFACAFETNASGSLMS